MSKIRINLILLTFSFLLKGQSLPLPKNIQSPIASSLGKYGDVPVNFYTGKVGVNVPVFSTTENNIPLNIDFNYDTGGVRVNDMPNWIGQNWNMNAGGIIMRTEKGSTVDELIYHPGIGYTNSGYYYNASRLNGSNWSDENYLRDVTLNETLRNDLEPDIFTFNFMGFTGKFFLGQDGQWKVQSDKNLKVEINLEDNVKVLNRNTLRPWYNNPDYAPKCFGKITITDESGNKYIFGGTQNAIEYAQHDFYDYERGVIANAWYLASVVDRLGNTVYTFEYDRGDFQGHFYLSYYSVTREKSSNGTFWQPGGGCMYSQTSAYKANGNLIIPSYLKKITTKNGYTISFTRSYSTHKGFNLQDNSILRATIDQWIAANSNVPPYYLPYSEYAMIDFYLFYHDQNENLLNDSAGIPLHDYLINKLKNVKLDYIDIKLNGTSFQKVTLNRNPTSERLNLLGITSAYANSVKALKYNFEYNNFGQLPSLLSSAMDHWGFYKGTNFNTPGTDATAFYLSREPNSAYMQVGSLTKINYPTGGYSSFEYEPNYYSKFVKDDLTLGNEEKMAGGLRIKKIRTHDGEAETIKEYKYTTSFDSNVSSGILALRNVYSVPDWFTRTTENSLYRESVTSLNNILPLSNFSGSHIGYSKVYEIFGTNKGVNSYEYTNYSEYPDIPFASTISLSHSIFDTHTNNDFKRGLLKKVEYFDSNTSQLIKKVENIYQSVDNKKARGFIYDRFQPCQYVGDYVLLGNAYEIEYSDFKPTSSVITEYRLGQSLVVKNDNVYKIHSPSGIFFGDTFLQSETLSNNNVEIKKNEYKYPFDFSGSIEQGMVSSHFLPVIEKISSKSSETLEKEKNNYGLFLLNGNSKPMIANQEIAYGNTPYELNTQVDKYDNNGNIVQYKNKAGILYSFIWQNELLIATLEGATADEYNYTSFTDLNNVTSKKLTKYTYTPFKKVSTITYPNGDVRKYFYDGDYRLFKVTDKDDVLLKKHEYNIK